MEEINLVQLWKQQNEKLDQTLILNRQLLAEVLTLKAKSALNELKRFKTSGIIVAIIYLIILGTPLFYCLAHYNSASNYFIVSIGLIFIINIKALADYIKHLVWISQIDYNAGVTDIQQKLTSLQISIFSHCRIMVLQFPLWTTFYLSNQWFPGSTSWGLVVFQVMMTTAFTVLAIWLYKNMTTANVHKKWVRLFIEGSGGKSVYQAIAFYKEIQHFKTGL